MVRATTGGYATAGLDRRARLATRGSAGVDTPLLGLPATPSWPATASYLHAMGPGRLPSVTQVLATGAVRAVDGVSARLGRRATSPS